MLRPSVRPGREAQGSARDEAFAVTDGPGAGASPRGDLERELAPSEAAHGRTVPRTRRSGRPLPPGDQAAQLSEAAMTMFEQHGYRVAHIGSGPYNGVTIRRDTRSGTSDRQATSTTNTSIGNPA